MSNGRINEITQDSKRIFEELAEGNFYDKTCLASAIKKVEDLGKRQNFTDLVRKLEYNNTLIYCHNALDDLGIERIRCMKEDLISNERNVINKASLLLMPYVNIDSYKFIVSDFDYAKKLLKGLDSNLIRNIARMKVAHGILEGIERDLMLEGKRVKRGEQEDGRQI